MGARRIVSLLLMVPLGGCVGSESGEPAGMIDDGNAAVADTASPAPGTPDEPLAVDVSSQLSVLDALLSKDTTWGLFSDETTLVAISSTGEKVRLHDEPFYWVRVDYELGLLWLSRSWSDPYLPGLFIADLRNPTINPVRVTHLRKGFRVSRDGAVSISMDAHRAPYHVYEVDVKGAGIRVESRSKYVTCKDECAVEGRAIELLGEVRRKPPLFEAAKALDIREYTRIELHATCPKCGRFVPLPETMYGIISVPFTDHPGELGWQIYDPRTDEFISDLTFQRSKSPHPEGEYANFIMVCKGGKALVVERRFVTSELKPLWPESLDSQGVCLTGGTSFIDG